MSVSSGSYQLPDFLSFFEDYHELNINKNCRSASLASEKWVRSLNQLRGDSHWLLPGLDEAIDLDRMKLGLLGACCFPSCDLTQLILIVDFWTLIVLDSLAALRSDSPPESEWSLNEQDPNLELVELIQGHPLFNHLLPRLTRLRETTSSTWQERFSSSIAAYRNSQKKAIDYRRTRDVPPLQLDGYISFRRDLSGLSIIIDLIEPVEGLDLDIRRYNDELRDMRHLAVEIIALTWDVFSYNVDQSLNNKINLISVLQSQRKVGLSSAISEAGKIILQRMEHFKTLEQKLISAISISSPKNTNSNTPFDSSSSLPPWSALWSRISSTQSQAATSESSAPSTQPHDIALYIRGLKDCMVGFLNWAYETELFFGTKGESIKGFGWVFLLPPNSTSSGSSLGLGSGLDFSNSDSAVTSVV